MMMSSSSSGRWPTSVVVALLLALPPAAVVVGLQLHALSSAFIGSFAQYARSSAVYRQETLHAGWQRSIL